MASRGACYWMPLRPFQAASRPPPTAHAPPRQLGVWLRQLRGPHSHLYCVKGDSQLPPPLRVMCRKKFCEPPA